ncbi:MAG: DUF6498-containing protein [Wenzhouxiangella sp.]|jgi:hypothetical protein|nr:DUF6498-containing protein [Wenzhouxiangella sp.]
MALTKLVHAPDRGWRTIVPDLIGCAVALLLAWSLGWRTGDLIWSMWLASLAIGYSLILWNLFGPASGFFGTAGRDMRSEGMATGLPAALFGNLFLLAFFTVHFGGFHWGHSIFVNGFYPITPDATGSGPGSLGSPTPSEYWVVVKTYGWFLPLAFLAQRGLFSTADKKSSTNPSLQAESANDTARAHRRNRSLPRNAGAVDMGAAYKGVVKLHLLIFFLFGADAVGLPEFLSFTVVYLVYFLPWTAVFGKSGKRPIDGSLS